MKKILIDKVGGQIIESYDKKAIEEEKRNLINTYKIEGLTLKIQKEKDGQIIISKK